MIEFNNVTLKYHYEEFALLKGASFTLKSGVNTILADSQSGKSSICKLLMKEVRPTSGEISVDGLKIDGITNADLGILYLPSAPTFFPNRSVLYNIEYPLKVRKIAKNERRQRAIAVAELLGIDFLDEKAKKLTAEQKKLVALARGLTVKRKIALFDDFFAFEGDASLEKIKEVLKLFDGATCVILTSDKRLAQGNAVVLDGGVTVFSGEVNEAQSVVDGLGWIGNFEE